MLLSDRRRFLAQGVAFGGLTACGFTPAYGPQGGAQGLQRAILLDDPDSRDAFAFVRRTEERIGRPDGPPKLVLSYALTTNADGVGSTPDGRTTRFQLVGQASYKLRAPGADEVVEDGMVSAFVGYSTTGNTVSTLAAERDARKRLMVILADKMIDRLILRAADLPLA